MSVQSGAASSLGLSDGDPRERFELVEILGEGSYGKVFSARDRAARGQLVAVKVLHIGSMDLTDLRREIEILRKCKSPYVISYVGSWQIDQTLWVAMEYAAAGSASDVIASISAPFPELEVADCCAAMLLGLQYLHSIRVIHRDLKGGNVLLTTSGGIKLADFGVSAQLQHSFSRRQTMIGSPFWLAPEVIEQAAYGFSADIWSLGITAIELAEGVPPYHDLHPMRAIFVIGGAEEPPGLAEPEKFSPVFRDFLAGCLRIKPEERSTAEALLSHEFVADRVRKLQGRGNKSRRMGKFVRQHQAAITAAREEQMKREVERRKRAAGAETPAPAPSAAAAAGGGAGEGGGGGGTMVSGSAGTMVSGGDGTMVASSGTMVSGSSGTMVAGGDGTMVAGSGTMVAGGDSAMGASSGTMVSGSSGTMVAGGDGTMVLGGGGDGTMVAGGDGTMVLGGGGDGTMVAGSGTMVAGSGTMVAGSGTMVAGSGTMVAGSGTMVAGSGTMVVGATAPDPAGRRGPAAQPPALPPHGAPAQAPAATAPAASHAAYNPDENALARGPLRGVEEALELLEERFRTDLMGLTRRYDAAHASLTRLITAKGGEVLAPGTFDADDE